MQTLLLGAYTSGTMCLLFCGYGLVQWLRARKLARHDAEIRAELERAAALLFPEVQP